MKQPLHDITDTKELLYISMHTGAWTGQPGEMVSWFLAGESPAAWWTRAEHGEVPGILAFWICTLSCWLLSLSERAML